MKIRIIVAEDHELVRESTVALLRDEADFNVIEQCEDGRVLLEQVKNLKPDVVIVDVFLPKLNGIEAVRQIRELNPATRVIALSSYTDEAYVREMIEAGAVGYIAAKSGTVKDLIQAIRTGTRSNVYLSTELLPIGSRLRTTAAGGTTRGGLTPREREILQLIAEGHSSKEIAALLNIGETTVKTHRTNIMDKLNIRDTAGLTRYAIRMGLTRAD